MSSFFCLLHRFRLILGVTLMALVPSIFAAEAAPAPVTLSAVKSPWAPRLSDFSRFDRQNPVKPGGTLFVGSSSIDLWKSLERDFPGVGILNRGMSGSELADCVRLFDQLVMPYAPSTIVLYAGDNDLAHGRSPQQVYESLQRFTSLVSQRLPQTRLAYISIKPSPSRVSLLPAVTEVNRMARQLMARHPNYRYVDIYSPMLGKDGKPRAELFSQDALHMNGKGYQLWAERLRPFLSSAGPI